VNNSGTVDITVTPVGLNYASYPQDGACNNTTANTNSLNMANLAVELIAPNGTTVLASAMAGAVGVAETINDGPLAAAGTYFIRVTETDSPTQVQLYTLTVNATLGGGCIGAAISTQPTNQSDCVGGSASFTVAATGTAPLTYQWRRGTTNLVDGGSISGAQSPALTIDPVAAGDAATNYNCVVTNACGSATSNNVSLTVNVPPSINSQPSSTSACPGGSASFTVSASGTSLSYQWRRGATLLTNGGNISGATSPTLTINPVGPGDVAVNYNCLITNACDNVISDDASLTLDSAPAITGHPGNQSATRELASPISGVAARPNSSTAAASAARLRRRSPSTQWL
jgi:hypothetical protein